MYRAQRTRVGGGGDQNSTILGVAPQKIEYQLSTQVAQTPAVHTHQKFRRKYKLKIALASDPEVKTAGDWDVWIEKSLYGRKYMGMERATFLVDAKGVIIEAWHKVKVPGHVEAVLAAAKKL